MRLHISLGALHIYSNARYATHDPKEVDQTSTGNQNETGAEKVGAYVDNLECLTLL